MFHGGCERNVKANSKGEHLGVAKLVRWASESGGVLGWLLVVGWASVIVVLCSVDLCCVVLL